MKSKPRRGGIDDVASYGAGDFDSHFFYNDASPDGLPRHRAMTGEQSLEIVTRTEKPAEPSAANLTNFNDGLLGQDA